MTKRPGDMVSMGKDREDERRAAGVLTTDDEGHWVLATDNLRRVYEDLGFDSDTQSTRLRVIEEVRY